MVNCKDIAREISRIYCPMTPLGINMLADILVPMKFQKGETILQEGTVCNALYFVEKGMVRQYYYQNKKDVTEKEKGMAEKMASSYDISDIKYIEPIVMYLGGKDNEKAV